MAKKKFESIDTGRPAANQISETEGGAIGGEVIKAIEKGTHIKGRQIPASPEEARERQEEMRTQGRKGAKAPRLYLALTPSNYEFIKLMSKASGKSQGGFINYVLDTYRKEHPELMEKASDFLDFVKNGVFPEDSQE